MSIATSPTTSQTTMQNRLLDEIWRLGRYRLLSNMVPVRLMAGQILHSASGAAAELYFIESGVVSLVDVMQSGRTIEAASIGREGVVGLPGLLGHHAFDFQCFVQIPGKALRGNVQVVRSEMELDQTVAKIFQRYAASFMAQTMKSVACNGLHSVQERCCRWLLCAEDRLDSAEIPITHEGLAHILGVRRASISSVLQPLQEAALVRYGRGRLVILDRERLKATACECYSSIHKEICGGEGTAVVSAAAGMN
jgi:CRP-like cAMP-binding protein